MQRSAFIIALFSLFAFFSLALARPLPVQAENEVREAIVELGTREVPVDHELLHREVTPDETGVKLDVLAREPESLGDYVRGVYDESNTTGDIEDVAPRYCGGKGCS